MRVKKITELKRLSVEEYKETDKLPLVVILDNVRSLNNVGAIFRSSDAFRVSAIYLCGITAIPPHADIHKTALGAEDSVPWRYFENTLDAVEDLRERDFTICAVEQTFDSILLSDFECKPSTRYAIIVGNEVKGVEQKVVDQCQCAIELPKEGTKHSLNVSVATGVVLWEFFKQLNA